MPQHIVSVTQPAVFPGPADRAGWCQLGQKAARCQPASSGASASKEAPGEAGCPRCPLPCLLEGASGMAHRKAPWLYSYNTRWTDTHFLVLTTVTSKGLSSRSAVRLPGRLGTMRPAAAGYPNVTLSAPPTGGDQDLLFTDEETDDLKRESDQVKCPVSVSAGAPPLSHTTPHSLGRWKDVCHTK